MPSVTYMNQSAPFWDFVASLEQDGRSHPFFSHNQNNDHENDQSAHGHPGANGPNGPPPPFGGWGWGFPFWGRDMPHHGPNPSGPGEFPQEGEDVNMDSEKEKGSQPNGDDNGEGPSNTSNSDTEGHPHRHGRPGRCGPGRRGGWRGHGGHGHGHGGFGSPHRGRRGGWGPWGARSGSFNPWNFAGGIFDPASYNNNNNTTKDNEDFSPETDVFDTPSAFIVHVSLPGAKKEDVGVNWDAEKSELAIAGVIYRPGDEEFLKTLAMNERKIGPFERKIRLGTRVSPAQIDAEGITAKLEDGLLRVEVPKLEKEGFVEVRKVDIE